VKKVVVTQTPVVGAVFSALEKSWGASKSCKDVDGDGIDDLCGHTGLVVAVNGDQVTVLETSSSLGNASPYAKQSTYTLTPGMKVNFVYVGEYFK
jgi:hypothetical protein